MRNILNSATRNRKFNILTSPTHERYQSNLDCTNAEYYLFQSDGIKDWKNEYAKLPENHFILPKNYIPYGINFDFVLSQNKFGQYQKFISISKALNIPLLSLEHCMPDFRWSVQNRQQVANMRGDLNLYITNYSRNAWGDDKGIIIPHCINTEIFTPLLRSKRNNTILTVNNDYIQRDYCLGFKQFQRATKGLPVTIVGDTPGLSKAAKNIEELVNFYQTSSIFINCAHWSPIPMSLLEALSSGCACVSINACAISEYIEHGINGFLAKNDEEMRYYLELLLKNEDLATKLGNNARKTIVEKCSKEKFTNTWNNIFKSLHENQIRFRKNT